MHNKFSSKRFRLTGYSSTVIHGAYGLLGVLTVLLAAPTLAAERIPLSGHTEPVVANALSADGRLLATGSHDRTLRVWDLKERNQQKIHTYNGIPQPFGFSADGAKLFVREQLTPQSDAFSIFDIETGLESNRLFDRQASYVVRGLSPDGQWLIATKSKAAQLEVWDVSSGKLLGNLEGSANGGVLVFSPDSRRFAVAVSASCRLLVWNVEGWKTGADGALNPHAPFGKFDGVRRKQEIARVDALAFSPDGRWLAVGGPEFRDRFPDECPGRVVVLNVETGDEVFKPPASLDGSVHELTFSDDRKMLISSANESGITFDTRAYRKMVVWNIATGARLAEEPARGTVGPVFSANGRVLAAKRLVYQLEDRTPARYFNDPGELRIWNRPQGDDHFQLVTAEDEFPLQEKARKANRWLVRFDKRILTFTPDGRWLIVTVPMEHAGDSGAVDYVSLIDVGKFGTGSE